MNAWLAILTYFNRSKDKKNINKYFDQRFLTNGHVVLFVMSKYIVLCFCFLLLENWPITSKGGSIGSMEACSPRKPSSNPG